ncbi:MAG: hypothetical protein PHF75_06000, partial [Gallionella sp.]|nr:hypothetical protein [Gallionella sp.]
SSDLGRAVQSVGGVHAIKPLAVNAYQAQETVANAHRKAAGDTSAIEPGGWHGENRRKSSRRISQRAILVELRSGRDRRHQMQCDSEFCVHIDAEV